MWLPVGTGALRAAHETSPSPPIAIPAEAGIQVQATTFAGTWMQPSSLLPWRGSAAGFFLEMCHILSLSYLEGAQSGDGLDR